MNDFSIFDTLFNNVMADNACLYAKTSTPRVDVLEQKDAYTLEMELPGRSENDVNIEVDYKNLKISSVKEEAKNDSENEKPKYVLRERGSRDFERNFILPEDVDTESIKANFKNGILTINMAKRENAVPRKIEVLAC